MQPQPSLPLVRAILAAQRACPPSCPGAISRGSPLEICSHAPALPHVALVESEYGNGRAPCEDDDCCGVERAFARVDGTNLCRVHCKDRGATEAQLDSVEEEVARLVGEVAS
jgi:hypothetical protein